MQPGYTEIPPPQYMQSSTDTQRSAILRFAVGCTIGTTLVILGVVCLLFDWDVLVAPAVVAGIVCCCVAGGCCDRCLHRDGRVDRFA